MSLFRKYEDRKENRMETGKADNVNNRQALFAEMLGVMARLGNDHGLSSSDAESHRSVEAAGGAEKSGSPYSPRATTCMSRGRPCTDL